MKISKNDPRLTAYALGEIDDPGERKAIEAAIAASPELQAAVAEIQLISGQLTEGLSREPLPEITEFEKTRMEQAGNPDHNPVPSVMSRLVSLPVFATMSAAAAVLLVFVLMPPYGAMKSGEEIDKAVSQQLIEPAPIPEPDRSDGVTLEQLELALVPQKKEQEVLELSPFTVEQETSSLKDQMMSAPSSNQSVAVAGKMAAPPSSRERDALMQADPAIGRSMATFVNPVQTEWNTESYDIIVETGFRSPLVAPLSTFSIDVDTASYANVRRFLNQGQLPPADAVRIEELINYFPYSDAPPTQSIEDGGDPFAVHMDLADAPWNSDHRLLRVALNGYEMPWDQRPASNLVFLLDVSGSMNSANKLGLVKQAMELLVNRLDGRDRVAIVVYAGASGLVLPSTTANNRETIAHAINNLAAGGSTNAGAGIELAYKVAREHFITDGNNRVILCTDGDFNVGQTNRGDLADIAEKQADGGISLTILGFGMGNYKDGMLETLSNKGKGSYAYIDSQTEARKVFLEDITSNIFKIAKDVKIQVEFNPAVVEAYRLIGYENRRLKAEDFNNDRKRAGDIGPGHSVVALYEIIPAGSQAGLPKVDDLRYQEKPETGTLSSELATVKLRYKRPEESVSHLIVRSVQLDSRVELAAAPVDFRFSAAVAAFGLRLTKSESIGSFSYREIGELARSAIDGDSGNHRVEFVELVRKAQELSRAETVEPFEE